MAVADLLPQPEYQVVEVQQERAVGMVKMQGVGEHHLVMQGMTAEAIEVPCVLDEEFIPLRFRPQQRRQPLRRQLRRTR